VLPTTIGGATASSSVNSGLTRSSFISFGRISDSGRVLATGEPPFFAGAIDLPSAREH
jgi:hypothetical protein